MHVPLYADLGNSWYS